MLMDDVVSLLPDLRAFARFMCREREAADELVQNTVLAALDKQDQFAIERRAGTDQKPILRLAGISTPEAVDEVRGQALFCLLADAPPLGEREWWAEELEGCSVIDGATPIGEVSKLLVLPSCEVLEVKRPDGTELLVPMVSDAIRSVDVDQRRIDVNLAFVGGA